MGYTNTRYRLLPLNSLMLVVVHKSISMSGHVTLLSCACGARKINYIMMHLFILSRDSTFLSVLFCGREGFAVSSS